MPLKDSNKKQIVNIGRNVIHLMTSNICNARCLCCPHYMMYGYGNVIMNSKLWNSFCVSLQELIETGPLYDGKYAYYLIPNIGVNFGFLDEPLCDENILNRIISVKKAGCTDISFLTNCSLLSINKLNDLLSAGISEITLSLLAANKDKYERITGLNFDVVIQNIKNAISLLLSKQIKFKINAPVDSYDEVVEYRNIFGSYIFDRFVFINKKDNRVPSYKKDQIDWNESCFRILKERDINASCIISQTNLPILYNGDVPFCILDNSFSPVLNINNSSLRSVIVDHLDLAFNLTQEQQNCCSRCLRIKSK